MRCVGAALLLSVALSGLVEAQENVVPSKGYVPNANTALAIARAVLVPIYGQKRVAAEEPLTASRDGDTWVIMGDPHCEPETVCDWAGTIYVKLAAADGQIMFVTTE